MSRPGLRATLPAMPHTIIPGVTLLRAYSLAGRPIAQVRHADGGVGVMELRPGFGLFRPTFALYDRLREGSIDLDEIDHNAFLELVRQWRRPVMAALESEPLQWDRTGNGEFPFRTEHGDQALIIRVNDFPVDPLYSVLAEGQTLGHLEDWPPAWRKG